MGYSLRYEYGIFKQKFVDGWQTELPDFWLPGGSVWLHAHPEKAVEISFNGNMIEDWIDGNHKVEMVNDTKVLAVPYDMLVAGADGKSVNVLRLWSSETPAIDMTALPSINSGTVSLSSLPEYPYISTPDSYQRSAYLALEGFGIPISRQRKSEDAAARSHIQ